MKPFNHYVFTRFNLGLYGGPYVDNVDEWMSERMRLFGDYCLPAFEQQTCKRFSWVLAIDPATPDIVRAKIKSLMVPTTGFYTIIIEEEHLDWSLRNASAYASKPWVITTRFDNDDIPHKHYIEAIQASFTGRTILVDVRYDILDIRPGKFNRRHDVEPRRKPNSPFTSLIEPTDGDVKTVFQCDHSTLADRYGGKIIPKILATRLEHGTNLLNYSSPDTREQWK